MKEEPLKYGSWFGYASLEENDGDVVKVREVYERAIANASPVEEKRNWQRYIYLWILYEEYEAEDYDKTRAVYEACLDIIPNGKFTFGKVWIMAAQLEIRRQNLTVARKLLGSAIRRAPDEKLFKVYIETVVEPCMVTG